MVNAGVNVTPPGYSRLEILNIRKNQFSGKVPEGISSLIRLRVLDISSNKFSENLKFLKNSPNLEKLVLADNMFVGKLPLSLRSFRNLRSINISGNTLLEGPLPVMNQLEHLSSETIPNRYILAEKSIERNHTSARAMATSSSKGLNGSQAEAPSPMATTRHKHKKKREVRKVLGWVVGFLAGAFAGSLLGLVFSLLFKFIFDQRAQEGESGAISSPLIIS
ncbi:unnamed protein product [Fraxinus pennsylvanica]|uniref:Uncharacterized protein n=1 Tax=Fraxinus pennsylvanica TaxID=56036 RepID=A0AAD2DMA0_9LAMI|nr:unnamed protein product [Fraxinus pennsylvanica]